MKNLGLVMFLVAAVGSVSAFANEASFKCVTEKGLEANKVRTIEFKLDFKGPNNVSIVGAQSRAFRITPHSDALRALKTYDNGSIVEDQHRVEFDADEIGMYHTTLVLWKKAGFRAGYVSTSGESNVKLYSPIQCSVN